MAGKILIMSKVKQLLRLREEGKGIKTIASILGISKNTVKEYLKKVLNNKLDTKALMETDDMLMEKYFFNGTPAYKQSKYDTFINKIDYYIKELSKPGVTRKLLWEEYVSEHSEHYQFTQFCHHLSMYIKAQNPSMVLSHEAGDKMYIDFAGDKLHYIDKQTGELVYCQSFVACLPYSDYCFLEIVPSQKAEDFIYALTKCLHFYEGVPQTIVPDNLKSAVIKASPYEPDINKILEDFANHYKTSITPARVYKPKDKALVENQVKLIYNRVYAPLRNTVFYSLEELNLAAKELVKKHNQTIMQQKDYCREEKFISDERHKLKPLPNEVFEIKHYKEYKVAKNNHIYLAEDKHYYSVPYSYIGQTVKVVYTRNLAKIYNSSTEIAVHVRNYKKGAYTTKKEHLCSQHQHYLDRSPDYYLKLADNCTAELKKLFEAFFNQDKYPEQVYRTCDGLLRLYKHSDKIKFNQACNIAIENSNYSYTFIKNILINNVVNSYKSEINKPLPQHDNIRGAEFYSCRNYQ